MSTFSTIGTSVYGQEISKSQTDIWWRKSTKNTKTDYGYSKKNKLHAIELWFASLTIASNSSSNATANAGAFGNRSG